VGAQSLDWVLGVVPPAVMPMLMLRSTKAAAFFSQ
jgi:hypothetical protein